MRINVAISLLVLAAVLLGLVGGCGGDGGTTTPLPPTPDPRDQGPGGDPEELDPIGVPQGEFILPGG